MKDTMKENPFYPEATLGIVLGELATVLAGLTVMRAAGMSSESKSVVAAALIAGYTKLTMPKITDSNLFSKTIINGTLIYAVQTSPEWL